MAIDRDSMVDRREALKRVAILLGGALSAPTIAGALSGEMEAWAAIPDAQWVPKTMTRAQAEVFATMAEHIIPTTDTPGARTAGVHRYVDALLTQHYPDAEKARFLAGLDGVDVRARVRYGKDFLQLSKREQISILNDMDGAAFRGRAGVALANSAQAPSPSDSAAGATPQKNPADAEGLSDAVRAELRQGWFWRRTKELTLVGYYTSQAGATQELHVNPMGQWKGDVPLKTIGRSWA
jgi:gluconate 2-dehydrogenase gamma chain